MHPILFTLGSFTVYSYAAAIAVAYAAGVLLAVRRASSYGMRPANVLEFATWVLLPAVIGAKMFLLAEHFTEVVRTPSMLANIWQVAGGSFGAVAVGFGIAVAYCRRHGLSVFGLCDVCTPPLALGLALGKVGCFLSGCCYGSPTTVMWAVTFRDASLTSHHVPLNTPLHPVQLYESTAALLVFAALIVTEQRSRWIRGRVFLLFAAGYSALRFALEYFRYPQKACAALSLAQMISIVVGLGSVFVLALTLRSHRGPTAAGSSSPSRPSGKAESGSLRTGGRLT